jgi:hypothetical protein
MNEHGQGTAPDTGSDPSDGDVTRKLVGVVKAGDVQLSGSAAGLVVAAGDVSILNGGCGPVLTNGNLTIRNGGCGPVIARGNASIEKGGTQAIIAAGGARIGRNAFVGVVASPKVTIEDGGRVLLDSPMAIVVGAGVGLGVALFARLLKR